VIDEGSARCVRDGLAALFPPDVVTLVASPDMADGHLLESEATGMGRMVAKRRREYTAGRLAARAALARLGIEGHAVTVGPAREPQWPTGVAGSISHCDGLCVVAVARVGAVMSLGLDVEPATPLPSGVLPIVCTAAERDMIASTNDHLLGKLVFCAKESIYKAWFPIMREPLEFQEASVSIEPKDGTWTAVISRRSTRDFPATVRGRFRTAGGFLLAGLVVPPPGRAAGSRSSGGAV